MKQYSINHDSAAWNAFKKHYGIDGNTPIAVVDGLKFLAAKVVRAIGSKQAWIIEDYNGNKWLQSYNTIVSVKWGDTHEVEHFGKWSVTTSRHQSTFARIA